MATDLNNPSGIEFDDPGPGAGVTVPKNLAAPKAAAIAAANAAKKPAAQKAAAKAPTLSAKTTAAAAKVGVAAAAAKAKAKRTWYMLSGERYKLDSQLNEIEAKGGSIEFVVPSTTSQNAYDILYYIQN